jgi:hypothetical protein
LKTPRTKNYIQKLTLKRKLILLSDGVSVCFERAVHDVLLVLVVNRAVCVQQVLQPASLWRVVLGAAAMQGNKTEIRAIVFELVAAFFSLRIALNPFEILPKNKMPTSRVAAGPV